MLIIIISRSSLKLGHVGSKTRSQGQILENFVYPLEGTVLIQSSRNFIRMLMIMMSRSSLKLGHVGLKTRLLGQTLEKPCVHFRGHSFDSKLMKLYQNDNDHNI